MFGWRTTTVLTALSVVIGTAPVGKAEDGMAKDSDSQPQSIYDFTVKDIDGKDVALAQYKGGVLLIVNVASQ